MYPLRDISIQVKDLSQRSWIVGVYVVTRIVTGPNYKIDFAFVVLFQVIESSVDEGQWRITVTAVG